MPSPTPVDLADRISRKRAIGFAVAALAFLAVQLFGRPVFVSSPNTAPLTRAYGWALHAVVLLLLLATGGGLFNASSVRALVNDEVARAHTRTAIAVGYWLAMAVAMVLFLVPGLRALGIREAVYLIVTPSIAAALLAFSYLEIRAHRDG